MAFSPKRFSFILQRLADRVVARSELTDVVQGGNLWTTLTAVARELDGAYFELTQLQDAWDIDTATGQELDLRAADIPDGQIERRGAAKASTTLIFSRSGTTGTVVIPAGSIARVPGDGPGFATSVAGSILNGFSSSASIAALALEAGAEGNTDLNTITQMEGIAGVTSVTNPTPGGNGADEEGDEELRERLRNYFRSLSRGTADALKYAALAVDLSDTGFGRVVSVQVLRYPDGHRGLVHVFIDDGAGTVEHVDDNIGTPEAVVTNATGGELRFSVANIPVHTGYTFALEINAVAVVEGTDYRFDASTGLIILDETVYPGGLSTGDDVTAEYTFYLGLVAEVQKVLNGDPADRANYPGVASAGDQVFVLPPAVTQLAIEAVITPDIGVGGTSEALKTAIKSALIRYVNSLGIGQDVILTELVHKAQSIPGLRDIQFVTPTANVTVGDGELVRLAEANIDIT